MSSIKVLLITALSIGFLHTIFGPDHYLPFIVMSRARGWSRIKTFWITLLCGLGHVLSSVILGFIGIAFGIAIGRLEFFEGFRGGLAAWALITFGLIYMVWGITDAVRNKRHRHFHEHGVGLEHNHDHDHIGEHVHAHLKDGKVNITPWILFTIFVLGPCEPLIPLVMYPAAEGSISGVIFVSTAFSLVTILTMVGIVMLVSYGISFVRLGKLERYTHAVAGGIIAVSGLAIHFLGL